MVEKKNHKKYLIYASYAKLLHGGRHHGYLQTNYRMMTSTWLLGTFAGIGFLMSSFNTLPFDHLIGVACACIIGIVGIYLLWYADTFIQELLLDINVVEGLILERKYKWLPQIHHTFLHLYKNSNARFVKVLFFIGCKGILVFVFLMSLGFYVYRINPGFVFFLLPACLLLFCLSTAYMVSKTGKIQEFMEYLTRVDKQR